MDFQVNRASGCDRSAHHMSCWLWRQPKETQASRGFIGLELTQLAGYLVATAYNLVR